ncbi:MAG: methyltransferase, partial [Candidatus Altiarchaeales archaeon]|nr:methyltransferase [Candidatus Altiarchaeales archaeon]
DDLRDLTGRIFNRITGYGSFAIRCRSKKVEEILGAGIKKRGMEVNLGNPGVEIICLQIEAGKYAVGIDVPLKRDFNQRRPHMRPYFHPTSLHPKMARLAVNLAKVKKGDVVLDPFCGTGGILIEAGLMGLEVKGLDIDGRMVDGCRRNLGFYGLSGEIEERDALSLDEEGEVDAIVTDLPYGRGSFLTERNLTEFYGRFMKSAGAILKEGSYMVLIAPDDLSSEISEFEITGRFPWYVHKSLTRRIYVLRKNFTK